MSISLKKPRIHEIIKIMLIDDFIFNSKKIKKYFTLAKPYFVIKKKEDFPMDVFYRINTMIKKELQIYAKKYKLHKFIVDGLFFFDLINEKAKVNKKLNNLDFNYFFNYFKEFIIKIANSEKIDKKKYKEYFDAIKKIKEEYEQIKDIPTLQEKYPRIRS